MFYTIDKPDLSKIWENKNKIAELLLKRNNSDVLKSISKISTPIYLYWDKIKYKELPQSISSKKEFWWIVELVRSAQLSETVIKNENGKYFKLLKLPDLEQFLHQIDLDTGGNLLGFSEIMDEKTKYKFISRGVMEEAIASSQLEGASTTRRVAKQFLREGKKPRNIDEQMILNNYQVMRLIETEDKDKKLEQNIILDWHRIITHKTNVSKKEVGKFRSDKNNIVVGDKYNVIYHCPPKMDFVRKEITRLIKFANDDLEESSFIHPVIKAIMLHFWIGYLHPFTDGNGRLARLLFYWYLLRKDYWAFAYLPISKVIKKSPVQYQNAYVYSEQNDNLDMTYFVDYNIRKIKIANKDFKEYLARKSKENLRMSQLSKKYNINERQIQLLQYLFGDKTQKTSLKVHMNIYQVSKATAIKDLKKLKKIGLLSTVRQGRNVYYYAMDKVEELFK